MEAWGWRRDLIAEVVVRHPASADRRSLQLSWRCECTLFITYTSLTIKSWLPAKANFSSVPKSNAPLFFFFFFFWGMLCRTQGGLRQGLLNSHHSARAICSLAPFLALIRMKMSAARHLMNLKHAERYRR